MALSNSNNSIQFNIPCKSNYQNEQFKNAPLGWQSIMKRACNTRKHISFEVKRKKNASVWHYKLQINRIVHSNLIVYWKLQSIQIYSYLERFDWFDEFFEWKIIDCFVRSHKSSLDVSLNGTKCHVCFSLFCCCRLKSPKLYDWIHL